ncbi:MAG TPA: carbon-nitrogen hydrolase family protein [Chloroflexota bacterium]|jgi:nitrilase|nr:carbon-nitrogen hydrolase family protein [Chloroflexota bacterium]
MKVAIVQRPPVLLDREATLAAAVSHLHEAADQEARLVVFPETHIPGYPVWIWRLQPEADYQLSARIHGALIENSIDLWSDDLRPMREAAAQRKVTVVCGIHERDGEFSRSTIYNTLVTIAPDGAILNRHRKLMPTNPERMVWGQGDASGLRVVQTPEARLGGLICWENYMPLARYALYAEGIEVYVASTWDSGEIWISTMRHIAAEGRCWVIGSGCALRASDIPADFPGREQLFPVPGEVLNPGDSVIVSPGGEIIAGPLHDECGLLVADIEPSRAAAAHRTLDVAGHYGRSDIFRLTVDRTQHDPVVYTDGIAQRELPPGDAAPAPTG